MKVAPIVLIGMGLTPLLIWSMAFGVIYAIYRYQMKKAKIPSMPKPSGLSCCLIDFIGDDDCSDADYDSAYAELKDKFIEFMTNNDRVAAMTQHWSQGRRYPHVHISFLRGAIIYICGITRI